MNKGLKWTNTPEICLFQYRGEVPGTHKSPVPLDTNPQKERRKHVAVTPPAAQASDGPAGRGAPPPHNLPQNKSGASTSSQAVWQDRAPRQREWPLVALSFTSQPTAEQQEL
ncbi:hypothetical protein AAFF_G00312900 [Aldrovandia affinis]|uniref:Uncharacterized protein n=1 Tax=Aldrovandia affinis TaxID=143900 RepID=A0AAD7WR18_9TELE|nr:hypothetical protein AAFF_G00312900 [Aldrovandia affinis]